MSRRIAAIAFAVFVFLGITFMVTRALVGAGNERADVLRLLRAQARGDASAVLARLPACAAVTACARTTRARVTRLRRPGEVVILAYTPSVQVALTTRQGTARVAWQIRDSHKPVVQCVKVRRKGPLAGGGVELMAISNPIGGENSCP